MTTDGRTYVLDNMGYYITYGEYCKVNRIVFLVPNSVVNKKVLDYCDNNILYIIRSTANAQKIGYKRTGE